MKINALIAQIALLMVAVGFANSSYAVLAGGTTINNSATVNYEDLGGNAYSDDDTVVVTVRTILEFEWRNYSSGLDVDAGDATSYATEVLSPFSLDLANIGNSSDNLVIVPSYDNSQIDDINSFFVYECSGDGTLDTDGSPGDDLTCVTALTYDADNNVTVFAYGINTNEITNPWNATGVADEDVKVPLTFDLAGEIVVGDLVTFDDANAIYEVIAVDNANDFITVNNEGGVLTATIPGLLQEVKRFKWYGGAPTLTSTPGSVVSHGNVYFEMDAQDSDAVAADGVSADQDFCTDACSDGGTDNTDTDDRDGVTTFEQTLGVLGPDILIIKYVGPTNTPFAKLTITGCDTRDFDGSAATYDFYGDQSGADGCTVDDIDEDEVLRYVIAVNNRAGGLTAPYNTARSVSSIHLTAGGTDCFTQAQNTCVGRAYEVNVTDTYPDVTTLTTTVHKIETSCDTAAWVNDATGDEDAETYSSGDGRIVEAAGTITWYVDDVNNVNSNGTATGDDTGTNGTIDPAQEVCLLFQVEL